MPPLSNHGFSRPTSGHPSPIACSGRCRAQGGRSKLLELSFCAILLLGPKILLRGDHGGAQTLALSSWNTGALDSKEIDWRAEWGIKRDKEEIGISEDSEFKLPGAGLAGWQRRWQCQRRWARHGRAALWSWPLSARWLPFRQVAPFPTLDEFTNSLSDCTDNIEIKGENPHL